MWRLKTLKYYLLLLAFCFSVVALPISCQAYEITEAELNQLEMNLNQLENINKQQLTTLKKQKSMLNQARFDLEELQYALTESKKETQLAQNSLQTANELLIKYEQEEKRKQMILKRQRNIAYIFLGCSLIALAIK